MQTLSYTANKNWMVIFKSPLDDNRKEYFYCTQQEGEQIMAKKATKQQVIQLGKYYVTYSGIIGLAQTKKQSYESNLDERNEPTRFETCPPSKEIWQDIMRAISGKYCRTEKPTAGLTETYFKGVAMSVWNIGGEFCDNMIRFGQSLKQEYAPYEKTTTSNHETGKQMA